MPRPPLSELAPMSNVDLSAVAKDMQNEILGLFEELIRLSSRDEFRRRLMTAVDFPSDDIPTFLALNQLSLHGALRPTVLAERLETGRPNVTKIVRRLESLGLVVRLADPDDDRGILVALAQRGREIAERLLTLEQQGIDSILAEWPASDILAFRRLLSRYVGSARPLLEDNDAPPSATARRGAPAASGASRDSEDASASMVSITREAPTLTRL